MNNNEWRQLALIVAVIAIGIAIGAWLFFRTTTVESLRVPFTVIEEGSPKLYLKSIAAGRTGAKVVALENSGNRTRIMHLIPSGAYADWLMPDQQWIVVKPDAHRAIVVWVHVPNSTKAGAHEGTIEVVSYGITI